MTYRTPGSRLRVGAISSLMLTVDPPLEQPPVSLIRAIPPVMDNRLKPVAFDWSSRRPAARSPAVGPANSRSITLVAGVLGRAGRRTLVTNGGVFAANIDGPEVIVLEGATLRIDEGWSGRAHVTGGWVLTRTTVSADPSLRPG